MADGWVAFTRMLGETAQNYVGSHPHLAPEKAKLLATIQHMLMPEYLENWPIEPAQMVEEVPSESATV